MIFKTGEEFRIKGKSVGRSIDEFIGATERIKIGDIVIINFYDYNEGYYITIHKENNCTYYFAEEDLTKGISIL